MRIRNMLMIESAISIILILVFSWTVYTSFNVVAEENEREFIVNEIQQTASELNIIMYDYLNYREERMVQQWNQKYDISLKIIEKSDREELKEIRTNYAELKSLFSQIVTNYEAQGSPELEERLVAKLLIESHTIIFTSARISKEAYSNAVEAQRVANNSMVVALIALIILLLASSYTIARKISKPVNQLTDDVRKITKGKLNIKLKPSKIDEIQSLTESLTRILASLKLAILKTGTTKASIGLGKALKARKKADAKAKKKTKQLERFAKLAVGREEKMIELKNEIDRLKKQLKKQKQK